MIPADFFASFTGFAALRQAARRAASGKRRKPGAAAFLARLEPELLRLEEELRAGKGRVASIRAGFDKAFWTIMDSNITTLIAALFLAQLGSGPIQGFAISLSIGCISSLFTALFVSHLVFDFETEVLKVKHVSISWRIK